MSRPCSEILLVAALAGCGRVAPCGDPCGLTDENGYRYTAELDVAVAPAAELEDVRIAWGDVTTDLRGHAYEPADVDESRLVFFTGLAPDEVEEALATDTLDQSDVGLYMLCSDEVDHDCQLSEYGILGSQAGIDAYFEGGKGSWLFALVTREVPGARALLFLDPVADGPTEVAFEDGGSSLAVEVQLDELVPVGLSAADVVIDWSALSTDGLGNAVEPRKLDRLEVARYDMDLEELEARFLDLEQLATGRWSFDTNGETSASLADLEGDEAFPGVDDEGTWLLALWCTTCQTPAPRFLTVVRPPG